MSFQAVHVEYLTPSRTVETIEIRNKDLIKKLYVYNYEGYSFRMFENEEALHSFFAIGLEPELHFSTEQELDDYLLKYSESE